MAIKKISELPALVGSVASDDILPIVDTSETSQQNKTKKTSANQLRVFTASQMDASTVANASLQNSSVTTAKLGSSAVTDVKIASSAVTEAKIATGAVSTAKLATDAVTTVKINDMAVTVAKLAGIINPINAIGKFVYINSSETMTAIDHAFPIVNDKIVDVAVVSFIIAEENEPLEVGQKKLLWVVPPNFHDYKITQVVCNVMTASTSGLPTFDIRRGRRSSPTSTPSFGSIFSTKPSIDVGEFSSLNAATPAVINNTYSFVKTDDVLSFDITIAGTITKYLCMSVEFRK